MAPARPLGWRLCARSPAAGRMRVVGPILTGDPACRRFPAGPFRSFSRNLDCRRGVNAASALSRFISPPTRFLPLAVVGGSSAGCRTAASPTLAARVSPSALPGRYGLGYAAAFTSPFTAAPGWLRQPRLRLKRGKTAWRKLSSPASARAPASASRPRFPALNGATGRPVSPQAPLPPVRRLTKPAGSRRRYGSSGLSTVSPCRLARWVPRVGRSADRPGLPAFSRPCGPAGICPSAPVPRGARQEMAPCGLCPASLVSFLRRAHPACFPPVATVPLCDRGVAPAPSRSRVNSFAALRAL